MVIDTSALLAVLLDEPEAQAIARVIAAEPRRLLSAFTALETSIVIEAKKGPGGDPPQRLAEVRQGPAPRGPEHRRLLLLRARPIAATVSS